MIYSTRKSSISVHKCWRGKGESVFSSHSHSHPQSKKQRNTNPGEYLGCPAPGTCPATVGATPGYAQISLRIRLGVESAWQRHTDTLKSNPKFPPLLFATRGLLNVKYTILCRFVSSTDITTQPVH